MQSKSLSTLFFTSLILFSGNTLPLQAAWSPPVQISMGPVSLNAGGTTPLVIGTNSTCLVGCLNGQIGNSQIISSANLFPESTAWTPPQTIYNNTIPGTFPSFPTMAVDVFGNQIAGFGVIDPMSGVLVLNATRRKFGSVFWEPPITQIQIGTPSAASLAIGNLGNFSALFALTTTGTPPYNITFVQLPGDSSSWLPPIVLAQDNSTQPALAAKTYLGISTFAWKVNMPSLQLQTGLFDFDTQALMDLDNVSLPPLTTDIVGIDVAVSQQGSILIFSAQIGPNNLLYSTTLFAGQNTWTAPLLISDPANTVTAASIASDAAGNATIIWGEEITPTEQYVRVASLPLGGSPNLVTNLTSPSLNTTVDASTRVIMDSYGNAAAIWGITMGGAPMIQVSTKAIGENWTPPETLSLSGVAPLIALSDQGTAVATWLDSVTNILMGSRNLFLYALIPPEDFLGTVVKNEFLTETAYFLKMQWKPSLVPNISSYEIFKNGKLVGTTSGNAPFTFLEPLNSKHVKSTYSLVAVASNGNKSLTIPITIQK